jgi:hypothetical protein
MPQTVIFLEDLDPGEKGIAEMLAPVSIRRLTLCFSIVSIVWGSSGWEALGPVIWWEALALVPLGTEDSVPSNAFSGKWGQVPEVASSRHSLLK